jgi:hypothetical protein
MKLLRILGGSVLWILAGVVGLLGALLSITVILAPIGIPLLMLARRLFRYSMTLLVPRQARHPVETLKSSAKDAVADLPTPDVDVKKSRKKAKKLVRRQKKRLPLTG